MKTPRFVRTVQDSLLAAADAVPDKTALVTADRRITYRELKDHALRFTRILLDRGLERGDRIAIFHNNSWQTVVAIYGTLLADGVFFVVNPQTKAEKLEFLLLDSGARFLVAQSSLRHRYIPNLSYVKDLRRIFVTGPQVSEPQDEYPTLECFEELLDRNSPIAAPGRAISADLASLVYTSGSTGSPKGVMMTHRSMGFVTESLVEYLRLDGNQRFLGMLPLAFDYGLYQLFQAVRLGATLVLERSSIYPAELIGRIDAEQITVFPGVPTVYALLISLHKRKRLAFPSVLRVTNTAAALPKAFIPELQSMFPNALVFTMYGLTECKRVCYLEPELVRDKAESVGKPIPGTEVFLLSPDGKPVRSREPGILHVRGEHVMLGYWNQPERTRKALKPGYIPYDRILNTGDWFRVDEEGFLYFLGRSDEIIKTRGEKVSPVEVENALHGIDGIREAAVIGVPDPILGQAIHAFVALDRQGFLSEKQIRKECTRHLEDFMVPKKVTIMDDLPKNNNGKVRKQSLIDQKSK